MPIVKFSLRADLEPEARLTSDHALQPLRDEGVLIADSGMIHDGLRTTFGDHSNPDAEAFDRPLTDAAEAADPADRERRRARTLAGGTIPNVSATNRNPAIDSVRGA